LNGILMAVAQPYLGTDVGGTFTDLVLCTPAGELHCLKVLSTPARPGASVLDGIDGLQRHAGSDAGGWRDMHHTHSSTVATNALIERRGACVGLITTAGVRDVLELQRLAIPHPMRFDSRRPLPLVPRALTREVRGRIGPEGEEIEPLDEAGVAHAARELTAAGAEIIVVALIHGYRNAAHERRAGAVIDRLGLGVRAELSSEVWPQAREYERTTLATMNASIRPVVEPYVGRLADGLAARGFTRPARIARSNGGAELAETVRQRPVVALLSGPAAGVAGATAAAEDAGWLSADLMTLDVGGTSADIGVIRNGRPVLSSEEQVADFPVLIPTIAVSSIGAGGGSIIWLDAAGSLKVGPRSVGADPGPACYGLSDQLVPSLTDAFLVAGLLAPGQRLGGALSLRPEPARAALEKIAAALGCSIEEAADGAIRVAIALTAAEASRVLARRGVDAEGFRMVAFGGAGPLLAALLANEIAIDAVLIPPLPGALSAFGAALADIEGDLVRPVYRRLDAAAEAALRTAFTALAVEAEAWIVRQTADLVVEGTAIAYAADMRYEGQGYDLTVPLRTEWLAPSPVASGGPADVDLASIAAAFHDAHRVTYGHTSPESEIWLKELRVHMTGRIGKPRMAVARQPMAAPSTRRPVRLDGHVIEAAVVDRAALADGAVIQGPTIVNQMDTTTLIPPGWQAEVVPSGALILRRVAS
jgi:N-methylhydantoinase A